MNTVNGRELLLKALRNETTSRPAWVPFVGVHGAHLIGEKAGDYLRSSELITRGLKRAIERYRPDGLPVVFDLQIEAEVLGCELHWADRKLDLSATGLVLDADCVSAQPPGVVAICDPTRADEVRRHLLRPLDTGELDE